MCDQFPTVTDNPSILTDAEMNNRRRVWSGYPLVKPSKDAVPLLISVDQDVRAASVSGNNLARVT
jgi:hypothetical protein